MKIAIPLILAFCWIAEPTFSAESKRKSLLDTDPDVIYLDQHLKQAIELDVVKEAPVFGDKNAKRKLGTLKSGQKVQVEAITDKAYRVRGEGLYDGIAGWVGPWAFSSKDPDFVAHLKQFYERQIQVQKLIEAKQIAIGMTLDEVSKSRGEPTKTSVRMTAEGQEGRWEYIDYVDVKNYVNQVDPSTGMVYRQLVSVTREEKGKTVVEFKNGNVTALEESEDRKGGNIRIIIPPVRWCW